MKNRADFIARLAVLTAFFLIGKQAFAQSSCTASSTLNVTISAAPSANFVPSVNGLQAVFQNNSTNSTSFSWDFGDGSPISTAQNPTHDYALGGSYTVILTATGGSCGAASFTQVVNILSAPNAQFSPSITNGCAPLTVVFTNQTSNGSTYNWSFPGGTPATSTAQNPTVVYQNAGVFSVHLTATNASGSDSDDKPNLISVGAGPTASFTAAVGGAFVSFTNGSTNATSFSWNFGDGSPISTAQNPTHNFTADGTYTVILNAINACGTMSYTQTVTVVTAPTADFSASQTTGCAPLTVQFQNQSSSNAATFFWSFVGGQPETSTEQNPTVVYENPGSFHAELTVGNAAATDTKTQTNFVEVAGPPTAGFAVTLAGLDAAFENQAASATTVSWNFGDGSPLSNELNPSHHFSADGSYNVILTATNNCGSTSYNETLVIGTLPHAAFSASQTTGCAPLTIQFQNESSANSASFFWEFSGGQPATSSQQNPTVVFQNAGSWSAQLTVSNATGADSYALGSPILVGSPPSASFAATVSGLAASFSNNSQGATSFLWNFGDGSTSTAQNPTHNYATGGVFQVTLVATNACGSFSFDQTITTLAAPVAGFTASVLTGCAPLTVQFLNQSSQNSTDFLWNFAGGTPATSTEQNPTVVFENAGQFSASLTATNGAGSDAEVKTNFITVLAAPTAGFAAQTMGLQTIFTNNSTNASQFFWDFGDGTTSTEQNPTHLFSANGSYTVVLQASNGLCAAVYSSQTVVIAAPPKADFSASGLTGCAPLVVQFSNNSFHTNGAFSWTFDGGQPATSTEQNPLVTYATAGVFGVNLSVVDAFGSDFKASPSLILVNDKPSGVGFSFSQQSLTVDFLGTAASSTSVFWDFGDGSAGSNLMNPTHTFPADGQYVVTFTATNGCGSTTFSQNVVVTTIGSVEPTAGFSMEVFPNPNGGVFSIKLAGKRAETTRIRVLDVLGRVIFEEKMGFETGVLSRSIALPTAAAGSYFLEWATGDGSVFYRKIEVQR